MQPSSRTIAKGQQARAHFRPSCCNLPAVSARTRRFISRTGAQVPQHTGMGGPPAPDGDIKTSAGRSHWHGWPTGAHTSRGLGDTAADMQLPAVNQHTNSLPLGGGSSQSNSSVALAMGDDSFKQQSQPSSEGQYVQHGPGGHSTSPTDPSTQPAQTPEGNDHEHTGSVNSSSKSSKQHWHVTKAKIAAFVISNFMLISFSLAAALAMAWPLPGRVVASWSVADVRIVQAANNFLVFLISGLTLKSDDFRALKRHWLGVLYGLVAILLITPCFAFLMMLIPLQPKEFATGLALFCVVPTTLGVGVALTAAAKGNQALALLLTVSTNLLGIVTVPYEFRLVLSSSSTATVVSVDPQNLLVKLLLTVLVPSVIGKLARDLIPPVCRFVTKHKTALSLFSTLNLAAIVWQTLSGARDTLLQQAFLSVFLVVVLSSGLHLVMLALNGLMVSRYVLRLPFREAVAVLIMSSQKSAPVAVTVITYLTPNLTQQGLMAIPCILGQLAQIFIGSALAKYLRNMADKRL